LVIVTATDADHDALVYDWTTDSRLRISGVRLPLDNFLYNTVEPTRVFYPNNVQTPLDTAWIECGVRDRRGGEAIAWVRLVIQD
jgi:hypothetical protein